MGDYLYRGVHANHPDLSNAKVGRVVPGNKGGTITPEQHNLGGFSADSPYTSWTHDIDVALTYASSRGKGGVLLRVNEGSPPHSATWRWEWSPDIYSEREVLLWGERSGLTVDQHV